MSGFRNVKFYSRECNGRLLNYDEACLDVIPDRTVTFYKQYLECEGCNYVKGMRVPRGRVGSVILKTIWPVKYKIVEDGGETLCKGVYKFKEYGKYNLSVGATGCGNVVTVEQPDEPLLPLLGFIVTLLFMATFWYLVKAVYRKVNQWELWNQLWRRGESGEELLGSPTASSRGRSSTRLHSMDIFRGITISLMILVNYGGGGYSWLEHSPWNGLTVADVVFPWFAFLMGASACLALHTRLRTQMTRWTAFLQVLRRSVYLIFLGVMLSSRGLTIENLRLPGVLQRLGLAYLIFGMVECYAMNASNNYTPGASLFRDLRSTSIQWLFTLSLVAVQVCLSLLLVVPGCPRGYLGPGGLHLSENATTPPLLNCTGGAAGYIDRLILGELHLHKGGTFKRLYHTQVGMDPEGLLGTLTCVLCVQLGAQAARILLAYSHARARLSRWVLWSLMTCLLGACLCGFSQNGGPLPINKNLWSLSFCLVTSGLAFFVMAALYLVVDMRGAWGGRPFYYAGRNSLLLYMGHKLLQEHFPFEWRLEHPSHTQLLAMNALGVLLWLAIAAYLHRKKIILAL